MARVGKIGFEEVDVAVVLAVAVVDLGERIDEDALEVEFAVEGHEGVVFGVAQICNLPYRRFAICGPPEYSEVADAPDTLPTASRRYGRLQICATLEGLPSLGISPKSKP